MTKVRMGRRRSENYQSYAAEVELDHNKDNKLSLAQTAYLAKLMCYRMAGECLNQVELEMAADLYRTYTEGGDFYGLPVCE